MNLAKTLKGMKDAKVTKKGAFLGEGIYTLKVRNTLIIEPMAGPEAFILEAEVVQTSDPENHPVGSERTWYQSFKFRESALGELKKFTYACLGLDATNPVHQKKIVDDVDPGIEALLEKAIEGNKFRGELIRCEVIDRQSKKLNEKGEHGTYSSYNFSPAPKG